MFDRFIDLCLLHGFYFGAIGSVFFSFDHLNSIIMKLLHIKVPTFLKLVLNNGENGGTYRKDFYFSIINSSNYFS